MTREDAEERESGNDVANSIKDGAPQRTVTFFAASQAWTAGVAGVASYEPVYVKLAATVGS